MALICVGPWIVGSEAAGRARGHPAQPGGEESGGQLLGPHGPAREGTHEALYRQPPLQHHRGHAER